MATAKLGFRGLTISDKIQKCRNTVTLMTGNINFLSPNPSLAAVTSAIDALEKAYEDAMDGGKSKKAYMRIMHKALNILMKQLCAYIQQISAGDATIIHSSGLETRLPKTPPQPLSAIANLRLQLGLLEGTVSIRWKRMPGSALYIIQTSADGSTAWEDAGYSTKASITLKGYNSGDKVWARISGINACCEGPWSSPAKGMAR